MDTTILSDLGFTQAEIKIYLGLLELGPSPAGEIIQKTNLQSSVVHMTLNNLIQKGFLSFVKKGRRNIYQASNPNNISEYIDEKKKEFNELLPKLLARQDKSKDTSSITSFKGIKGIRELLYELLDAGGKEHLTFGSAKDSLMMGDTFWHNYHRKRAAKGIRAKLLFNESLETWVRSNKYPLATYKFTEQGFEPLTETIIRNDSIGIIIWTEVPLGILIRNKIAAESYKKYWETLWNLA